MEEYQKTFNSSIKSLKNKGIAGISMVEKAFKFAEKKHSGVYRKSGDPYILHPVCVMAILEKLDFESDVLCSALLHDVVEDCNVTVKELEKEFNPSISQIVDAVSEIKPNEKLENIKAEIKTYQKLVAIGKINKFAFYIKFADRLHNLSTISVFPRYKQVEKVKQTQKFIVPLLKILKARELYTKISNECFKILTNWQDDFSDFEKIYLENLKNNKKFNQILNDKLFMIINETISKYHIKNSLKKIIFVPLSELEIKNEIEKIYSLNNTLKIKSNYFVNIPNFNIFFIFSNQNYSDLFFKLFQDKNFTNIIKLIGFNFDEFSKKAYYLFENQVRTKFKAFFFSQSEYNIFRNGSEEGIDTEIIEDDFEKEIISDFITIKTRSNEIMLMPKGSTVLDFAFKIHNDFGFSCKYAILNDSPNHKSPIYTKLSDGDKVNLIIEEDDNKNTINIAKLKWLTYVNNEKSKKMLLKYFENLYE